MKKVYLLVIIAIYGTLVFSQSAFTIITPVNPTADLVTPTDTDVTSDTAEYFNSSPSSTIVAPLLVINNSGLTIDVKVRRTVLSVVPGSVNFFCWDLCYAPGTSVSGGTVSIAAGDTAFLFYADYNPSGNSGTSYIKYKFYNNVDSTEFASATIKYTSGTVGIEDEEMGVTNVYPNPASQYINFDYSIGSNKSSISIADITGKIVRNINLQENSSKQVIGLDGLTDGIYIYTFYVNGKAISTKKFIIKK